MPSSKLNAPPAVLELHSRLRPIYVMEKKLEQIDLAIKFLLGFLLLKIAKDGGMRKALLLLSLFH